MESDFRPPVDIYLQPGGFHFGGPELRIRTVLGSCVSIIMWHRQRRIGGMCHYMLPERLSRQASRGRDGRYAGDAVQFFREEIRRAGTAPWDYEVKLVGGGRLFNAGMDVGRRNIDVARRLLREHGFSVVAEHLAGVGYRHVVFEVDSGQIWLKHVTDAGLAWRLAEAPA